MSCIHLTGSFAVKEGAEGRLSLVYEAGPGPMVVLKLRPDNTMDEARVLARTINWHIDAVILDYAYPRAAKLGYGPTAD